MRSEKNEEENEKNEEVGEQTSLKIEENNNNNVLTFTIKW
jgi:hypothetical protein